MDRPILPLEQMREQDREAADQFALLRSAHAFDLFGDVFEVRLG